MTACVACRHGGRGEWGIRWWTQACSSCGLAGPYIHGLAHNVAVSNFALAHVQGCMMAECMACRHGGRGERDIRWWTQACGSCGARGGCTTASASSAPASWSRTCCCPGSGASSTTGTPCWMLTWSALPSAGSMSPAAWQVRHRPAHCLSHRPPQQSPTQILHPIICLFMGQGTSGSSMPCWAKPYSGSLPC